MLSAHGAEHIIQLSSQDFPEMKPGHVTSAGPRSEDYNKLLSKVVDEIKPQECPVCVQIFYNKDDLSSHMSTVHGAEDVIQLSSQDLQDDLNSWQTVVWCSQL